MVTVGVVASGAAVVISLPLALADLWRRTSAVEYDDFAFREGVLVTPGDIVRRSACRAVGVGGSGVLIAGRIHRTKVEEGRRHRRHGGRYHCALEAIIRHLNLHRTRGTSGGTRMSIWTGLM